MSRKIFILAGEESGDARAASLLRAALRIDPGLQFAGAGGPAMRAVGGEAIEDWIAESAVVGLWDVLRQYPFFRRKFQQFASEAIAARPDVVLFVDYPGFNLRMAKALRSKLPDAKFVYFISPQVWAWNQGRIPKMARMLDLMICIFPFEKILYERSGLQTVFAGHPMVGEIARECQDVEIARKENLLGFFPGSRRREIERLFPVMLEAAEIIRQSRPEVRFAVAAASARHAEWMREAAAARSIEMEIRPGVSRELMRRATAGLVCSGTATLEAAICGLPYALVYKVPWLTFLAGKMLIRIPYLGIVNILAGRGVVREMIQSDCTGFQLADEALRLLNSSDLRDTLRRDLALAVEPLGQGDAAKVAAEAVLNCLRSPKN